MKQFANISNYLAALIQLVFGLVYLFRNEFMPYHSIAAGMEWNQLNDPFQILFLAGMRIAAFGFISSGMTMAFLQYQLTKQFQTWIAGLIFLIGTLSFMGTMYAVLLVKFNTPGNPPMLLAISAWGLVVVGFWFNWRNRN